MRDKRELQQGRMLSDKHMYAAHQLLRRQFPWVSGLQDTCLSQTTFQPVSSEGVQIHHTRGNHWVVSACLGGRVLVYDSIYDNISKDLRKQLAEIYANAAQDGKTLLVEIPFICKQKGRKDCGLYAIASAFELCQGNNVLGIHFKQSQIRDHLLKCFEEGRLESFPQETWTADCVPTNFEMIKL